MEYEITFLQLLYSFVILLVLSVLSTLWLRNYLTYKNFPPGPSGWPIVGSLFTLGEKPHETLAQLSQKYGPVIGIKLGMQRAVILNDYETVRDAFVDQADIFSARPPIFVFDHKIKNTDIATSKLSVWRKQRNFVVKNLKPFGFGMSSSEALIIESIQMVKDDLDASKGSPLFFQYLFFLPILNVIWRFSANHSFIKNSVYAKDFCDMITANFQCIGNKLIIFLPILRFVPGGFGFTKQLQEQVKVLKFLTDEIKQHRESFISGQHRDFIDAYLQEIIDRKGTEEEEKAPFNEDHLVGTLYDLFLGGSDTTSNTLLWGFLLLAIHSDVQRKIQAEMDLVIGRGRQPCYADANRLPYLEATIMEIHRRISLIPLAIFHTNTKEVNFHGFRIPKGTTIIENIYAIHREQKYWTDPDQFCPERFLNENNRVIKPPYLIPFSIGPRICPGEQMAKMQLQLFFSILLHKYSFSLPPGEVTPSLEPIVAQTLSPQQYSLCVTVR